MSEATYWATKADEVMEALLTRIPENKLRPRLEPTARAVELLGDPQKSYRVIHVTGTNGKTSTTRFIERILREFGLRTGRFTSPHLVRLNERMSIEGEPVSDQALAEVWADTEPLLAIVDAELEAAGDTRLTFFEALAALGFAVFADAPVDVLVLEVGMGGQWDSTNVADGDVAVFTPISIDHAERLGSTIREIAETKAGIIKPAAIVLSSQQTPDALAVLKARAEEIGESFASFGTDFEVFDITREKAGQRFSVRTLAGEYHDLFIPLHGEYQVENAALAICAAEAFVGGGKQRISEDVIRVALADFSSPGRLQVVSRDPLTILDAAHNPDGARSLARALRDSFDSPRIIAVLSILEEKDARGFFEELRLSPIDHVIVTKSTSPRAMDIANLTNLAREYFTNVTNAPSVFSALEAAKKIVSKDGAIVIAGSITLVGDALRHIQEEDAEDEE
ncbi:MAG: bifunctional folylpolyglutamate synthase/dihydrofolate synthase [Micrococcales bacterium]